MRSSRLIALVLLALSLPAHAGFTLYVSTVPGDDKALISDGTTIQPVTVPNCPDTGGNHLNYNSSTNTLSCGTSSSGGGGCTPAGATNEFQINNGSGGCAGAHGTTSSNNITYSVGTSGEENNIVFASGGIRGKNSSDNTAAITIGIHGGDNTNVGRGGGFFARGGNSTSGTGGDLTIGPGIGSSGASNGDVFLAGMTQTGSQTATFSATNKPGSGTTSPSLWARVVVCTPSCNAYYFPLWQ